MISALIISRLRILFSLTLLTHTLSLSLSLSFLLINQNPKQAVSLLLTSPSKRNGASGKLVQEERERREKREERREMDQKREKKMANVTSDCWDRRSGRHITLSLRVVTASNPSHLFLFSISLTYGYFLFLFSFFSVQKRIQTLSRPPLRWKKPPPIQIQPPP